MSFVIVNTMILWYNLLCRCVLRKRVKNDFMKRKGFTLLEISISIVLILLIIHSAFSLMSTTFLMKQNIIAEKELIEVGEFLQNKITTEFSRAESIDEVLGKDGNVYSAVDKSPIDARAVKLKRSKNIPLESSYLEELIYLKDFQTDARSSLWIFKNARESLQLNIKNYSAYGGYEIGTYVESMKISLMEKNIYQIELGLRYLDTDIVKTKHFLVKLQD